MSTTCWILLVIGAGLLVSLGVLLRFRRRVRVLEGQVAQLEVDVALLRDAYCPGVVESVRRDLEQHNGRHLFFAWGDEVDHSNLMAIAEMAWLASKLANQPLETERARKIHPMLDRFERRPASMVPKTPDEIRARLLKLVAELADYCVVRVEPRITRLDVIVSEKEKNRVRLSRKPG